MAKRVISQNGAWNQHPWLQSGEKDENRPVIDWKTPKVIHAKVVPVNPENTSSSVPTGTDNSNQ